MAYYIINISLAIATGAVLSAISYFIAGPHWPLVLANFLTGAVAGWHCRSLKAIISFLRAYDENQS